VPEYVYGYDKDELETVVGRMLLERGMSLAVAESCTGGYLGHAITRIPGSSRYFTGGIIAYENRVKVEQLNVSPETLEKFGAVSEQTVLEMAGNVRKKLNTSVGVATSGIAGPDGGTEEKPVGTVWIAYADGTNTFAKKLQLFKDREINIKFASLWVLNAIRQNLPPVGVS
jgi:nicotinamide-nucleotide amidase